jgi:hypothetical protein
VLGILHSFGSAAGEVAGARADYLGHVVRGVRCRLDRPAERSTVTARVHRGATITLLQPRAGLLHSPRWGHVFTTAGATAPLGTHAECRWCRPVRIGRPARPSGGAGARVPVAGSSRPPRRGCGCGCEDPGVGHRGGNDDVAGMGVAAAVLIGEHDPAVPAVHPGHGVRQQSGPGNQQSPGSRRPMWWRVRVYPGAGDRPS